jgi:hypothetical protein
MIPSPLERKFDYRHEDYPYVILLSSIIISGVSLKA